jgi:predicted N-formylglutamate amidohydrolase
VKLLVTCEHGGNRIPEKYWPLFKAHRGVLDSHRGYDPGALAMARDFAAAFDAELVYSTTSRLLVELNRSLSHRQLFSEISLALPPDERERVVRRYYQPYREWVEAQVSEGTRSGREVVHISCHSFTPILDGDTRRADIGLLYDPARAGETQFCLAWQRELKLVLPRFVVRRNYPYKGYADGLTTFLRTRYPDPRYRGIELEVNQKHPLGDAAEWRALRKKLVSTLKSALRAVHGG